MPWRKEPVLAGRYEKITLYVRVADLGALKRQEITSCATRDVKYASCYAAEFPIIAMLVQPEQLVFRYCDPFRRDDQELDSDWSHDFCWSRH